MLCQAKFPHLPQKLFHQLEPYQTPASKSEIVAAIKSPSGKAVGIDGIPAEFYKYKYNIEFYEKNTILISP